MSFGCIRIIRITSDFNKQRYCRLKLLCDGTVNGDNGILST